MTLKPSVARSKPIRAVRMTHALPQCLFTVLPCTPHTQKKYKLLNSTLRPGRWGPQGHLVCVSIQSKNRRKKTLKRGKNQYRWWEVEITCRLPFDLKDALKGTIRFSISGGWKHIKHVSALAHKTKTQQTPPPVLDSGVGGAAATAVVYSSLPAVTTLSYWLKINFKMW